MTRPIYETQADLQREEEVKQEIERCWHITMRKLDIGQKIDYMLLNASNNICGFVEIKNRFINFGQYADYMLSKAKFDYGRYVAEYHCTFFILVAKFYDGIYYANLTTLKEFTVGRGGRTDRMDSKDMESVVHIPWGAFKPLVPR